MATYLASVQIGRYDEVVTRRRPGAQRGAAAGPAAQERRTRLRPAARDDDGVRATASGPTRSPTTPSSSPTTSSRSRSRRRACRSSGRTTSTGGAATSGWSRTSWRTSGSATASPSPTGATSGCNEGFACYAEWLWSEASGGRAAAAHAREWHAHAGGDAARTSSSPTRAPARMFDDRVYKRGALTAARAARSGRRRALLRAAARLDGAAPARDGDAPRSSSSWPRGTPAQTSRRSSPRGCTAPPSPTST